MAATASKKQVNPSSEWVGFPTTSFLNPIPSPYNFTNSWSKRVLLIADSNYVSKYVASYLDTTLHVSGFKVTKFTSISSAPLLWIESKEQKEQKEHKEEKDDKKEEDCKPDAFWEYKLNLSDFDCILIPSQINGDIWNDITEETRYKLGVFVEKGGCLICCHFRGTTFINSICNVSWHEISVKIGASYHIKKEKDILFYKNDVRGVVNVNNDDIIYKTKDDFTTVGFKKYGDGYCYYIGHDFSAIWEKTWNKILFNSIKKILTNSEKEIMNLSFGDIDIEAFKNLNIESNKDNDNDIKEIKDIYLEEFQPDFQSLDDHKSSNIDKKKPKNNNNNNNNKNEEEATKSSFDGFDEIDGFDNLEQEISPKTAKEYESIGYVQMDDNGIIKIDKNRKLHHVELHDYNIKGTKLNKINEIENVEQDQGDDDNDDDNDDDDDEDDEDESLEEVD